MSYEALRHCRSSPAWWPGTTVACGAHDHTRDSDRGSGPIPLRLVRTAHPTQRPFLVPAFRVGDGNGLALFGDHHFSDGRPETWAGVARRRVRYLYLRRSGQAIPEDPRRVATGRRNNGRRRRSSRPHITADGPGRQQRCSRWLPAVPSLIHSRA
jgi:hypothetical protein